MSEDASAAGGRPLDHLRAAVSASKAADPMALVTVVAPNNIAGIVARRHLAGGSGIAGIEVTTLARLAERLAAPLLAPRRPVSRAVLAAAWRRALAEVPTVFRDVAEHPATVRALAAAHADLRDLSPDGLAAVGNATELARDLVALHEAVMARLLPGWYDTTDVLTAAADHVTVHGIAGSVVLYLPQRLTRAEARFARAVRSVAGATVVAALTGVARADRGIVESLAALGVSAGDRPPPPVASRVITASDSDDEVRCVVRDLVTTLRTTPAHRVAVLYADAKPYARLLHAHLQAAGVTFNGPGVRPADERAAARALLEILDLAARDVPRGALFQALAAAPVRDFTGERVPVSRWERVSRAAGVVAGADWSDRLDGFVRDRRARAGLEAARDDSRAWLAERYGREAEHALGLQSFVGRLRQELRAATTMTTWAQLTDWAQRLFGTLLGPPEVLTTLPPEEKAAAASVVSILGGLSGLDAVEDTASFDTLRDVLALELAGSLPRVGRFGEGVFVAPLSAAVGLDLDVVYVCGLSEDLHPGRMRADALLPDRVRQATGGELPATRERIDTVQRHLLTAFSAARVEAVASFPRGDLRRSTRRLPSRFLLPSLRALAGDTSLAATAWDAPDYGAAVASSPSYAGELLSTRALATEQEWRTRQAAAIGSIDDATVTAAVAMIRARSGAAFTRFDGNLTGVDGLPDHAHGGPLVSPTALEAYAACPHAYFVERLLRVTPLDQPEDIVVISPVDIGNIVHRSIDRFVREFADALPGHGEPWSAAQRSRFLDIVGAQADEFERLGLTGHPRIWEGERRRVVADALRMLDVDDAWRARSDIRARVLASELPFGSDGAPPVEIAVPGGVVRMRGSADKVDRGVDGTLYVTDIKTGKRSSFSGIKPDNPVADGAKLQLPVYAHAVRARFGQTDTPVRAQYWFVRREPGWVVLDLTSDVERIFAATIDVLVRSIARGLFPLRAPVTPDYAFTQCAYCNPDGLGHGDERARWERKRLDPVLREFVSLVEPGVLPPDDAVSGGRDPR